MITQRFDSMAYLSLMFLFVLILIISIHMCAPGPKMYNSIQKIVQYIITRRFDGTKWYYYFFYYFLKGTSLETNGFHLSASVLTSPINIKK